ncbi:MFS transporter [Streptomyces sp. SID13031]|uniref:MFS transporter n=1 Tax=Streptomyces sp. SID13031 TaxID=2706046 RepID=UPI0013C5C17F|nr:MFS transporter [Streptomyces sp. SID13031]NEA36938.1 MFS transporter [Streptomyces sp. SID13031]
MSTAPPGDAATNTGLTVAVRYQPKTRAFRRYTLFYAVAGLGITLLWGSMGTILIPLHVQQLEFAHIFTGADTQVNLQALNDLKAQVDAGTLIPTADQNRLLGLLARFNSARAGSLSLVTSSGVFITMLIQPVVGMLSDRTRSPWGRRAPWIAAGGVAGAALVALLPVVPSIAILLIVWSLAQLLVSAAQGPLMATVVDRVPDDRIGAISTVTGLMVYVGGIGGSVVAGALFAAIGLASYFPLAVALALATLCFVLFARDRSSRELAVEPLRTRIFLTSYVQALSDRDYRWAWIAKVLLFLGYGIGTVYGLYMLQSYVTPALSATEAARVAPLMQLAGLPAALIGMVVSGRWSDRIGRRKPFVVAASLILAASFLIPFAWPTVTAMYLQGVVAGIGMGVFIVVDQALFIDLLPHRESAGRDLGLSNLGTNLGQALGPILAGVIVVASGGAYGPVWPVAFVLVLGALFAILPVRRAR